MMFLYLISSGNNNAQYAAGTGSMYIQSDYGFYGPTIGLFLSYIPDGFLYDNTKLFYLITGGDANDSRVGFMFCRLSSVSGNYGWAIELYFLADTIQFNNSTASYILIGGSIWDNSGGGLASCALINISSANSPYIEPIHTRWYDLGHTCWPMVYPDFWYV